MALKDAIQRTRARRLRETSPALFQGEDVREALVQLAEEVVAAHIPQMEADFLKELIQYVKKHIDEKLITIKGDKGDKGDSIKGKRGRDGKPGKSIKGDKGDPGKDSQVPGPKGDKGDKGDDGSPDTPDQVVEKLLTSKKKIPVEKISGLFEEITQIKRSIRGSKKVVKSGGGMGDWVHEAFALTSATSTVTLGSRVAAKGTAILVRYQGQMLAHGVEYTISNKIITLLITPDDSTVLDVTYVRT